MTVKGIDTGLISSAKKLQGLKLTKGDMFIKKNVTLIGMQVGRQIHFADLEAKTLWRNGMSFSEDTPISTLINRSEFADFEYIPVADISAFNIDIEVK